MLVPDATQVRNFDVEHMSASPEVYPAVIEDVKHAVLIDNL